MAFGDPPHYSTPRTLGLGAACVLVALAQFALGAFDDGEVSRHLGLGNMALGGLLPVYGVQTVIRYAEAQDALTDPLPRAPMPAPPWFLPTAKKHRTGLCLSCARGGGWTQLSATGCTKAALS